MWLLPINFMVHDFEEIIFINSWIKKNKAYIYEKFPQVAKRFFPKIENLSTASFSLAVLEEFILLSVLTLICVEYSQYSFFAVITIGYLFHVIVHLVQLIALQRYIPGAGTGIITGVFSVYTLYYLNCLGLLNWIYIWWLSPIVIFIIVVNLYFCHYLARRFEKRLDITVIKY
jgi:hypothetical protein